MSYTDESMNKMAEGMKSKGLNAEEAANNGPHPKLGESDEGHTEKGMSKSSEALKILGAGKPHGCTTAAMY